MKCFALTIKNSTKFTLILLLLVLCLGVVESRIFVVNFQNVTVDMIYPRGLKETGHPANYTPTREPLTVIDYSLLAFRDNATLAIGDLDSDCNTSSVFLFTASAACHSYAMANLNLSFSAFRPAVSAANPIQINAYVRWEAEGEQSGDYPGGCRGTEYAYFEIYVWNWVTGAWVRMYQNPPPTTGSLRGEGWYNISITSTDYISATTGEIRYNITVRAYDCDAWDNLQQAMCGSMATAYLYVDYVELVQNVPDANLTRVCVSHVSSIFPPVWSDVMYNQTVPLVARATTTAGLGIRNFPIKLFAIDEYGLEQFVGVGVTNVTNVTPFVRIISGEGYRMNFSRIEAWDGYMINNTAYVRDPTCGSQTITPPPDRGRNIAIVPATYVLNLVGRMYYPGGVDWARFVWFIHDTSVERHRAIPISQKFNNTSVSFSVWKFGLDYNCTDNRTPCDREGIFGTTPRPYWDPACITIGKRDDLITPFCDRTPVGNTPLRATVYVHLLSLNIGARVGGVITEANCYIDTDPYRNPIGKHRCGLFSGYRVGPLIQMNIPDNALGFTTHLAIASYGGTLALLMNRTNYSQHEGPLNLSMAQAPLTICGMSSIQEAFLAPHTEYVFSYPISAPVRIPDVIGTIDATGTATLEPDTRGGLGMIGFIGLYGDQKHVVGIILGHRFGVHPFLAIVQTVPEYPTTAAGWTGYEHRWLYYLYENLRFIAEAQGKELSIWNWRYPNATAQANLVRAFEDLIVDFAPFLRATLDLMISAPRTLVYPFVVTTFLQLGDFGYLMKVSYTNTTIFNKSVEASEALMRNLGNILGPPPPNCPLNPTWNDPNAYRCYGLNFIWMGSRLLTYAERELFAYRLVELFNTLIDLQIEVFKAVPELNNTTAPWAYPRWNYNWIHPE